MIINSSPLIIFGKLNKLELLEKTLQNIVITDSVYNEVVKKGIEINAPEAIIIEKYIREGRIKIKNLNDAWRKKADFFREVYSGLDEGEAETIALALQEKEKAIIIDERIARQVAELNELLPIGSLGILLYAFKKKIINEEEIRKIINQILQSNFRLGADVLNEFWIFFGLLKKN